jgi:hypothetical protein
LVVLQIFGLTQEVAVHLQAPSAVSQVSPAPQVTPWQRLPPPQVWVWTLQVLPAPQVVQVLPQESVPPEGAHAHSGVVPAHSQGWQVLVLSQN